MSDQGSVAVLAPSAPQSYIPRALAENAVARVAQDLAVAHARNQSLVAEVQAKYRALEAESQARHAEHTANLQSQGRQALALHRAALAKRDAEHARICEEARAHETLLQQRLGAQRSEYEAAVLANEAEQARLRDQQMERLAAQAAAFEQNVAAQKALEARQSADRAQCQTVLLSMLAEVERGAQAAARLERRDSSQQHRTLQKTTAAKLARETQALQVPARPKLTHTRLICVR